MKQFAVYKKGDFVYDKMKCALFIAPSINMAYAFSAKCDFETYIVSINL